jgi:hypothetical protein
MSLKRPRLEVRTAEDNVLVAEAVGQLTGAINVGSESHSYVMSGSRSRYLSASMIVGVGEIQPALMLRWLDVEDQDSVGPYRLGRAVLGNSDLDDTSRVVLTCLAFQLFARSFERRGGGAA